MATANHGPASVTDRYQRHSARLLSHCHLPPQRSHSHCCRPPIQPSPCLPPASSPRYLLKVVEVKDGFKEQRYEALGMIAMGELGRWRHR